MNTNFFKISNKKIGYDTLIGNMSSATDCRAHKKGFCKLKNDFRAKRKDARVCYACKMEYAKNVLYARRRQERTWLYSFDSILKEIEFLISRNRHLKYIRLNESGDIISKDCIKKIQTISEVFPHLKVYFYTKRYDLISQLTELNKLDNVVVTISELAYPNFNCFKIVDELTDKHKNVCKGDCYTCDLCKVKHLETVYVKYH